MIQVGRIIKYPDQPRKYFDEKSLEKLADSIQQDGQETPIKVRRDKKFPGKFMLIAGERRWRAGKIIEIRSAATFALEAIVEVVDSLTEEQIFKKSFIENTQREDMTDLETAASFVKMNKSGTSKSELMKLSGKSYVYVDNYMRMHTLPDSVKDLMHPNISDDLRLRTSHAIDISRVKNAEIQLEIAIETVERNLTVKDTFMIVVTKAAEAGLNVVGGSRRVKTTGRHQSRLLTNFLSRTRVDAKIHLDHTDFEQMYLDVVDDTKTSEFHKKNIATTVKDLNLMKKKIKGIIDQLECIKLNINNSRSWDKSL